jgi:outer membrane lipoprotein-sorting protein
MRKLMVAISLAALLAASAYGQGSLRARCTMRGFCCISFHPLQLIAIPKAAPLAAQAAGGRANLEQVLDLLDQKSVGFKTVRADFEWDQFQMVVNEHEIDKGVMYFKRAGNNVDVAADIQTPGRGKKLVLKDGALKVYNRKTGQVTPYDAHKNRESFESFLAVGFGGRGHDLPKSFDLRYVGIEPAMGIQAYKLELVPKAEQARRMFPKITLWINQQTGMSVQQRLDQGEGDYRIAKYTNIQINQPLPPDAFDIKK